MKIVKRVVIVVLVLVLIFFAISFGLVAARSLEGKIAYQDIINKYAEEYDSDPIMLAAIINVESGFDTEAESPMGAKGLMQIVPETGAWIAEKLGEDYHDDKLHDPDYNVKLGAYYYEYLYEHFGRKDLALAAYNGGMGNVEEWLEDPELSKDGSSLDHIPFEETRAYVDKVLQSYKNYEFFYGKTLPEEDEDLSLVWSNYKVFLSSMKDNF